MDISEYGSCADKFKAEVASEQSCFWKKKTFYTEVIWSEREVRWKNQQQTDDRNLGKSSVQRHKELSQCELADCSGWYSLCVGFSLAVVSVNEILSVNT